MNTLNYFVVFTIQRDAPLSDFVYIEGEEKQGVWGMKWIFSREKNECPLDDTDKFVPSMEWKMEFVRCDDGRFIVFRLFLVSVSSFWSLLTQTMEFETNQRRNTDSSPAKKDHPPSLLLYNVKWTRSFS